MTQKTTQKNLCDSKLETYFGKKGKTRMKPFKITFKISHQQRRLNDSWITEKKWLIGENWLKIFGITVYQKCFPVN